MNDMVIHGKEEYNKLGISSPFIFYSVTIRTEAWICKYISGSHCERVPLNICVDRYKYGTESYVFKRFRKEFRNRLNDISKRGKDLYWVWSVSIERDELSIYLTVDNNHEINLSEFIKFFNLQVLPILRSLKFDDNILCFNEEYIMDKNIHSGVDQLHYLNGIIVRVINLCGEYHVSYIE